MRPTSLPSSIIAVYSEMKTQDIETDDETESKEAISILRQDTRQQTFNKTYRKVEGGGRIRYVRKHG